MRSFFKITPSDSERSIFMIYDCHLHTDFSGDCETPARLQIEQAIQLGMKELCITDHLDHNAWFCQGLFELDMPSYLKQLNVLKKKYEGRIRLNLGVELGITLREASFLEEFHRTYGNQLDFIIGSSHFLGNCDPYDAVCWEGKSDQDVLAAYFEASLKRVRAFYPLFDSYAHLDYIVRYAPQKNREFKPEDYFPLIDPILKLLIENGKCLECNTGGYKYGLGEPNPCRQILMRYRSLGGEAITIGSDAHQTAYVGGSFEACRSLLLDCGFRYYTVFHERKPEMIPL